MKATSEQTKPPKALHFDRKPHLSPLLWHLEQRRMSIILVLALVCAVSVVTVTIVFAARKTIPHSTARALLGMAQRNYIEGHYEKTVTLLQEIHDGKRGSAATEHMLGKAFFHLGDLEKAEEHYRASLKKESSNAVVLSNLALVLYKQHRFPAAAACYREVLEIAGPEKASLRMRASTSLMILEERHGVKAYPPEPLSQ